MAIRVTLSVVFNLICTTLIDVYYNNKNFKTYSARNSSKFYFYNIYFMLSQIAADFYGVLSAGLISLSDVNDVTKLKRIYSAFLFTLALKTGFVLLLQPIITKFNADFIKKMWLKFTLCLYPGGYRIYHRLEADAPIKHDISLMSSFLCQALFYISFFSTYLMPLINFVMLIGVLAYWTVEKRTFLKYSLVKDSLDINNINMIYCLGLYGFIFSQALSVGNIKIIIAYFNNPSFGELEHLLQTFFDYGIITLIICVTVFFNWYYSTEKIKRRVLQYLAKQERKGNLKKNDIRHTDGEAVNKYMELNPFYGLIGVGKGGKVMAGEKGGGGEKTSEVEGREGGGEGVGSEDVREMQELFEQSGVGVEVGVGQGSNVLVDGDEGTGAEPRGLGGEENKS